MILYELSVWRYFFHFGCSTKTYVLKMIHGCTRNLLNKLFMDILVLLAFQFAGFSFKLSFSLLNEVVLLE